MKYNPCKKSFWCGLDAGDEWCGKCEVCKYEAYCEYVEAVIQPEDAFYRNMVIEHFSRYIIPYIYEKRSNPSDLLKN